MVGAQLAYMRSSLIKYVSALLCITSHLRHSASCPTHARFCLPVAMVLGQVLGVPQVLRCSPPTARYLRCCHGQHHPLWIMSPLLCRLPASSAHPIVYLAVAHFSSSSFFSFHFQFPSTFFLFLLCCSCSCTSFPFLLLTCICALSSPRHLSTFSTSLGSRLLLLSCCYNLSLCYVLVTSEIF
jgi:hypothetical protein